MPAKQGGNRDFLSAKRLCLYGLLSALCLVFGFIESLFPLAFIAPGIKLGLSNAVVLSLAVSGDKKGAFAVNTARILLSNLLFGSAMSLAFALVAGIGSLILTCALTKSKKLSVFIISISGAVAHNILQTAVAAFVAGKGVFIYLPVLILGGIACGALITAVCVPIIKIFDKKI